MKRSVHSVGAVFVAGDEAATDAAAVQLLADVVEHVRASVEPFVDLLHHRAVVAQPNRPSERENFGREDPVSDGGPVVGGNVVVDCTDDVGLP